MRIVTGSLKGRSIPFNPRRHGEIRVTSARLKEAVFSMLGPLEGRSFLDLCSGSGQIALEAYSRGARVTACEPDGRRYRRLRELLQAWGVDEGLQLSNQKAQWLISLGGSSYDGVYVDPPYEATLGGRPLSLALAEQLARSRMLDRGGMMFVQHPGRLHLPDSLDSLSLERRRPFGDSAVSVYVAAAADGPGSPEG